MSVQAMTWAFDQDIPPKPKMVLMALANRADRTTGRCFPGMDTLSKEASVPERSLIRQLHALVRNGYVVREKSRDDKGQQRNNTYYLVLDRDHAKHGDWQWYMAKDGRLIEEDDGPDEAEETRDSVEPQTATMAVGSPVENSASPTATLGGSPTAIAGSQQPTSEPKPKTSSTTSVAARVGFSRKAQDEEIDRSRLRGLAEKALARVFVLEGSRAWESWCIYRKQHGQVGSLPVTTSVIEGRSRRGWWLPTLFPPNEPELGATGPPPQPESLMTKEDHDFMNQQHARERG